MEKLDTTQADQDKEISLLNGEVTNTQKELLLKLNKNDATAIWRHF